MPGHASRQLGLFVPTALRRSRVRATAHAEDADRLALKGGQMELDYFGGIRGGGRVS